MQDAIGGNSRTIMVATVDASNAQVQGAREFRNESWQNECNMRFYCRDIAIILRWIGRPNPTRLTESRRYTRVCNATK